MNVEALIVKGMISEMAEDDRNQVMAVYNELKRVVEEGGGYGMIALALLGSELSGDD